MEEVSAGEEEERNGAGDSGNEGNDSTDPSEQIDNIVAAAAAGGDKDGGSNGGGGGGLPGVLSLLSSSVAPLEAALGRRLFPIRVAAFERSAAGEGSRWHNNGQGVIASPQTPYGPPVNTL